MEENNSCEKSYENTKIEYGILITNYENVIKGKEKDIATQEEIIKKLTESSRLYINKTTSNDDTFRTKSKKSRGSSKNVCVNSFKREYPECNYTDVGLNDLFGSK